MNSSSLWEETVGKVLSHERVQLTAEEGFVLRPHFHDLTKKSPIILGEEIGIAEIVFEGVQLLTE